MDPPKHVEGELLVKFRNSPMKQVIAAQPLQYTRDREFRHIGWTQVKLPAGVSAREQLAVFQGHPSVEAAELNIIHENVAAGWLVANDPLYEAGQYGLMRICASNAWSVTTGSSNVVIAVMDSGVNYLHEDLAENTWRNPGEIPGNGIDDDSNGYVDDVHGIDAVSRTGDPMDQTTKGNYHGTACAGVIGAVGNNGKGLAGVAWSVQLVGVRFIATNDTFTSADEVAAIDYVLLLKNRGINIRAINMSFTTGYISAGAVERDAFLALENARLLAIASAGNQADNNDSKPIHPTAYPFDNIVSVAASDEQDGLASFSNWGATQVDLAAPGVGIKTTSGETPDAYTHFFDGTSAAAPYVSGAVALLATAFPEATAAQIKEAIMAGVDILPAFTGRMASNGRLNVGRAVEHLRNQQAATPPLFVFDPQSQLVGEGAEASFHASGCGTGPISYQWELGGAALAEQNSQELRITSVTLADAGNYRLRATNAWGSAISLAGGLTVTNESGAAGPVVFTTHPESAFVLAGKDVQLTATGLGSGPIAYQWTHEGTNIPGATAACLQLTNAQPQVQGHYQARAENPFGVTFSRAANLKIFAQSVIAFGRDYGQLSVCPEAADAAAISLGVGHGLALGSDGIVHAWGADQGAPVPASLTNAAFIVAAQATSFAITDRGKIVPWGKDYFGGFSLPAGLGAVVDVSFTDQVLALTDNGTIMAWGNNDRGQCKVPVGLDSAVRVAASVGFSLALRADGQVVAWGANNAGQLNIPTGLSNVVDIATKTWEQALALKEDGTIVPWGKLCSQPNYVPDGLTNVVAVGCGMDHNVALKEDGTLAVWSNSRDYASVLTNIPPGLSNVVELAVGPFATMVRLGNRKLLPPAPLDGPALLWSTEWGASWFGQTNVTHDGIDALQSPALAPGLSGGVSTTVIGPGLLSYWCKVSGEPSAGRFSFSVDGTDFENLAGEADWHQIRMNIPFGRHTLEWKYQRAMASTGAPGTAWLDQVRYLPGQALAPFMIAGPTNTTVTVQPSAQFRVRAIGEAPLCCQWRVNGVNVPAATNWTFSIPRPDATNNGSLVSVIVSNAHGSVTSAPAILLLGYPPQIVLAPLSQDVVAGELVCLSVVASNSYVPPFTFEWLKDSVPVYTNVSDNLTSFFSFIAPENVNQVAYRVLIRGVFGMVPSYQATIRILADADKDGMPDSWEDLYGLAKTEPADRVLDADSDGKNNVEEYLSGTNPTNAFDALRLRIDSTDQEGLRLELNAAARKTYSVEYSHDLTSPVWTRLADIPAAGSARVLELLDSSAGTSGPTRFYRVVTPKTP